MEPVYLISNIHRSGSSMMMHCLSNGGLTPVFNKLSDKMNFFPSFNYIPNPNGFYQYTGNVDETFYEKFKNKLIKCPIRKLINLPDGYYKLLFIKRNPQEIRLSMHKWTPYKTWGPNETLTYFYEEYINALIEKLNDRGDFEIITLEYLDIIKSPLNEFIKLVEVNWPINPIECSKHVDSQLHRLKLEK